MKLTILHTDDTHSYLDDMGKRAKKINEIREKIYQKVILHY